MITWIKTLHDLIVGDNNADELLEKEGVVKF